MNRVSVLFVALGLAIVVGADARAQTAVALDAPVSGSLDDALDTARFAFSADPGATLFVERLATTNLAGVNWSVVDAVGRVIVGDDTALGHLGPFRVMGGASQLVVESEAGGTGGFSFQVHTAAPVTASASLDAALTGAIDKPGRVRHFTLQTSPGERLIVDVDGADASLNTQLVDARGEELVPRSTSLADSAVFVSRGGDITVGVGEANATGTFALTVRRVVDVERSVALGAEASDVLGPGATHTWSVVVPTDARVSIDAGAATSVVNTAWGVVDERDVPVFAEVGNFVDLGAVALRAGTYRVRVRAPSPRRPRPMRFASSPSSTRSPTPSATPAASTPPSSWPSSTASPRAPAPPPWSPSSPPWPSSSPTPPCPCRSASPCSCRAASTPPTSCAPSSGCAWATSRPAPSIAPAASSSASSSNPETTSLPSPPTKSAAPSTSARSSCAAPPTTTPAAPTCSPTSAASSPCATPAPPFIAEKTPWSLR